MANMGWPMDHDPAFLWSLGISVACHVMVVIFQAITTGPGRLPAGRKTLEVVYEQPAAERGAQSAALPTVTVSASSIHVGGVLSGGMLEGTTALGESGSRSPSVFLPVAPGLPSSVVDLSNVADASQGDPVLLSYFSAIREQIQRTANQRAWVSPDASEGIVYVAFLLQPGGQAASPHVLVDRSAPSALLHEIAVKIINASSPFPPLPPSLRGADKTIVVPLEFLRGS